MLFALGAFIGSYLNVLAVRYTPETGFKRGNTGRSHCPYCNRVLAWYELIPLVSFIALGGRCRSCKKRISLQYPASEVLAGLILAFVPQVLGLSIPALVWTLAFFALLLVFLIDLRQRIIPDALTAFIALLGVALAAYRFFSGAYGTGLEVEGTFLGNYALMFWFWGENILVNHVFGALFGIAFLGLVYFGSRGRAMGFGDVKLAGALGVLMGWPDVALALVVAFIFGATLGLALIAVGRAVMRDVVPFGPFIVVGVATVFFFGYHIVDGYFKLFNLV